MIPGALQWNENLIQDLFNHRDQTLILNIPLSIPRIDGSWYWLIDNKGSYLVKSGYLSLQEEVTDERSILWKKLWKLNIPPKVMNFMWRMLSGFLPTADILRGCRLQVDPSCPICFHERESAHHLFLHCPLIIECWSLTSLTIPGKL